MKNTVFTSDIHKVGLHKDYPAKRGNVWFHISTAVDLDTNTSSRPSYNIRADFDNSSKMFDDYLSASKYYDSITKKGKR